MKILRKNEAVSEANRLKKQQIDEGVEIAKKVDALRTKLLELEKQEATFIAGMETRSKEKLSALSKQIEDSEKELVAITEKRLKLSAPIDLTKEWESVRSLKAELTDRETYLIAREATAQELLKREGDITEKNSKAAVYLAEARKIYDSTDLARKQLDDRRAKVESDLLEREDSLIRREAGVAEREAVLESEKKHVSDDKKSILAKGSELIARESSLGVQALSLENREKNVHSKEKLTEKLYSEATNNFVESKKVISQANQYKETVESDLDTKVELLTERERKIGFSERDIVLKYENIAIENKKIEDEKKHIASQQATLKQAWESIKKLNN